jgi:putative DNA primase/helicase
LADVHSKETWPEPQPLNDDLPPVPAFDPAFLPDALRPWVADIAERMQCPLDFVAVSALVALGSVIGRKVAIRPQRWTDWFEVANLWACIVGRPGALKSPAMNEALKPLNKLEAEARRKNEEALADFKRAEQLYALKVKASEREAVKLRSDDITCAALAGDAPEPPCMRRYILNDCTYESLGLAMAHNPEGVLAFRDELVSLLKHLDDERNASARGFYLQAWNGTTGYTFDRIVRGQTHIEAACLSLLGSTQPGRLAEYVRRSQGAGDDGMLQRFGLLVWPDQSSEYRHVDRYPDSIARKTAWTAFDQLDQMTALSVGAEMDESGGLPFLRFSDSAQLQFDKWRDDLEKRLRGGELSPGLESHLSKYRKLVPALALISHLADSGRGPISKTALLRALSIAAYAAAHARRCYSAGAQAGVAAAKAILSRLRKGDLKEGFSLRDTMRSHWGNLTDLEQVSAGLALLVDLFWLAPKTIRTGGRPSTTYSINPRALL